MARASARGSSWRARCTGGGGEPPRSSGISTSILAAGPGAGTADAGSSTPAATRWCARPVIWPLNAVQRRRLCWILATGTPEGVQGRTSHRLPARVTRWRWPLSTCLAMAGARMADVTAILDPECFVIGGGGERGRRTVAGIDCARLHRVGVRQGDASTAQSRHRELGNAAGLVGQRTSRFR